jgi:hypothetical protein
MIHIRRSRSIGRAVMAVAAVSFLILAHACKGRPDEEEEESVAKTRAAPAQIIVQNGQTSLTLDPQAQNRLGIEILTLAETSVRAELTAPAVVLSAQGLANLRNAYIAGQAQLEKARISLDVARKEYLRVKTLYQENQNASQRALESADGTVRAAEADQGAAQEQLDLQLSIAGQQWGDVVAKSIATGSAELQRILASSEMLVQVTIPSGGPSSAPARILLDTAASGHVPARFVSRFPRVDPRVQGLAFLYVAPTRPGLAPGANLVVHLPVGNLRRGLVVPQPAVVWSEGQAWAYRQSAVNQFSRRAVPTDDPVENGYFVAKGFSAGDRVVVRGGQALLSEELILQGQGGGAGDEDEH